MTQGTSPPAYYVESHKAMYNRAMKTVRLMPAALIVCVRGGLYDNEYDFSAAEATSSI